MKINRLLLPQLAQNVRPGHATIVYGPRRAGKTTLVHTYLESYTKRYLFLNADELASREALQAQDAKKLAELVHGVDLLVIDEAQRVDEIGLNIKILVDSLPNLAIIATGSASFDLANKINEPLTGRKTTFTLYPLSFAELYEHDPGLTPQQHLEQWLIWGGYPQSITSESATQREQFLSELVGSYLYKDILELEAVKRADKIVDLLRLLAFQIGGEVSVAELAANLSLNRDTVDRYLDLLEKVFVIFRVNGFSRNLRKEIAKNNRYYFYDNGVRNALIQNFNALKLRNDVGQLWENYIVSERRKTNQHKGHTVNSYFWRTYDQKEIDIVEESQGKIRGYEVKWGKEAVSKYTKSEFETAYPNSDVTTINTENFKKFLG
jgi:predicted AAA+ superfamily ATPase